MDRAITCFQKAILLDPNFALAYVGIADTYNAMVPYGYMKPSEGFSEARAAAKRALEIDPLLAEAHSAYAFVIGSYDWNWEEVEREHKRAIDLSPNREGPYFYSQLLRSRSGGSSALMPWFRGGSSSEATTLRSALIWSMC